MAKSKWVVFLTAFYKDKKKSNPSYKFSDAMKAAAQQYKKK